MLCEMRFYVPNNELDNRGDEDEEAADKKDEDVDKNEESKVSLASYLMFNIGSG